ncbi:MAG: hypothetical protein IPM06_18675 [Rhizobiales bacterium]|nr:hypothetical protein [Hyphomicrobiales bacterium]
MSETYRISEKINALDHARMSHEMKVEAGTRFLRRAAHEIAKVIENDIASGKHGCPMAVEIPFNGSTKQIEF